MLVFFEPKLFCYRKALAKMRDRPFDDIQNDFMQVSLTNGVPCIVFRGISDVAGGEKLSLDGLSSLAATNSFRVAAKFVELIGYNKPNL